MTSPTSTNLTSPSTPPIGASVAPFAVAEKPQPSAPELWEDDFVDVNGSSSQSGTLTAAMLTSEADDGTGTAKGNEWADIIARFGEQTDGSDEDTLGKRGNASKPEAAPSPPTAQVVASSSASTPEKVLPVCPEPAFAYLEDDDDDEDGPTWITPLDEPDKPQPKPIVRRRSFKHVPEPSASSKPSLRVQTNQPMSIEDLIQEDGGSALPDLPPTSRTPVVPRSIRSPERLLQPNARVGSGSGSRKDGSSPVRQNSFTIREKNEDWAIRPSVERLLDNLEDFFPNHDLDKPIVDTNISSFASPTATSPAMTAASTAVVKGPQKLKYKQSIRNVAQDRRKLLQRAESVAKTVNDAATTLFRRKSTKLWGNKVEEMPPAKPRFDMIAESPATPLSLDEPNADSCKHLHEYCTSFLIDSFWAQSHSNGCEVI